MLHLRCGDSETYFIQLVHFYLVKCPAGVTEGETKGREKWLPMVCPCDARMHGGKEEPHTHWS